MNVLAKGSAFADAAAPPGDAVYVGSPDDDVDCCEVCAIPAWVVR